MDLAQRPARALSRLMPALLPPLPVPQLLLLLLLALGPARDGVASTAIATHAQPTFANRLIKALGGTLCIASPVDVSNTARLKLQDCTSNDEMLFSYSTNHKLMPKVDPTKCLDVHSCSDTVGSCYLQLYDCWDGPEKNQQFEFLPSGLIKSLRVNPQAAAASDDIPAFCLKPVAAKSGPIQVHLAPCDTSDVGQKFYVDNWQAPGTSGASAGPAPAESGVSSGSTAAAARTTSPAVQSSKAAGAPHPPQVSPPGGESPIDYTQRLRTRADKGKLKTANGCTCKTSWEVEGSEFRYPNNCADPGQLKGFTWCLTEETPRCAGVDGHHQ